jgi:signal transduction histidine kinase
MFLPRLILIFAVAVSRYSVSISSKNRELAESLGQKAGELENALIKLQDYTEELKETADLRAKDQLMRELHDRLGHMLATASIGAQAAAVLVDRDPPAAKARIETVWEQIQAAMKSLRQVLNGGAIGAAEQEPVFGELVRLARETEARTGIPICVEYDSAEDFDALPLAQRSYLYNALMEGLTNPPWPCDAIRFEHHEGGRADPVQPWRRRNGVPGDPVRLRPDEDRAGCAALRGLAGNERRGRVRNEDHIAFGNPADDGGASWIKSRYWSPTINS